MNTLMVQGVFTQTVVADQDIKFKSEKQFDKWFILEYENIAFEKYLIKLENADSWLIKEYDGFV